MSDQGQVTVDETAPETGYLYDPAEHTANEVMEYLATTDKAEVERVFDAEAAGKNRSTLLDKIAALPAANEADTAEPVTVEVSELEYEPAPSPELPKVASDCVVDSDFHVGRAVNGLVCSYHAMHYDAAGNRRQ